MVGRRLYPSGFFIITKFYSVLYPGHGLMVPLHDRILPPAYGPTMFFLGCKGCRGGVREERRGGKRREKGKGGKEEKKQN